MQPVRSAASCAPKHRQPAPLPRRLRRRAGRWRRGDYLKPANEILQVCTPEYYAAAAAAVAAAKPEAELFVFTDDEPWAREHLPTAGLPATILPQGAAANDLALMQRCRGFVLSNSTYSWWAQYLADAPDKIVWAPDRWYAYTKRSDLYLPGWRRIAIQPHP